MNRKLRKLLKDPVRFTRDMVANRVTDAKRLLPTPTLPRDARRYSVVAAVYGVEKYLDDFFRSMVQQTLGFERRIQLIMVDDGSPDRSAEIIAAWQRKYPRSIRYVRKENGGQGSARNLGISLATGHWVTFVDPDDFVDERYFERVDELLARKDAADVALLSCNFIVYQESTDERSDTHPLRYRFAAGDRVVPAAELGRDVQLSVNSAFFRRDLLQAWELRFDEAIRPNFEDAHFVGRYLLAAEGLDVGFAKHARYYYRKREDESSTLDRGWTKPSLFDEVLERGCLDLLRRARAERGEVPVWLQRTVLYHLIWYFRRIVDHGDDVPFLSSAQKERFRALLHEIFEHVESSTIVDFELGGVWQLHKVGLLGTFKGEAPRQQRVYVDEIDGPKGLARVRYFHHGERPLEIFTVDGAEVIPAFAKEQRHDFLGETFVRERIVWLPLRGLEGRLRARIGGTDARMVFRKKAVRNGVPVQDAMRGPRPPSPAELPLDLRVGLAVASRSPASDVYRDAILLMDRDTQADDNAEHLYRYIHRNRPDLNAFFVLRRSSHDWDRLAKEGFRLLDFGSLRHRLALSNARHLISSHADRYVVEHPAGWRDPARCRFTFLQHGVTHNDISRWLNAKSIDCLVTASPAEHEAIVRDGSPYKLTEREVVLSGFPRHDALGADVPPPERILAIMPTWRKSLAGTATGDGNERTINPAFFGSEYALRWRALLASPALRALASAHGYRIQFFPHANVAPYAGWFAPPEHVEVLSHGPERSIQSVLRSAAILLTDYSSIAFEMAYLCRPIVYYQFDREQVFGGGHITEPGDFDYLRDGFGPVCTEERALLEELAERMRTGQPAAVHRGRMERAFAFRDGRSCERTLDAILALDAREHPRDRSAELLADAARSASAHRAWRLAEQRWARVIELPAEARPDDAELRLAEVKRELGKVDEADALLHELESRGRHTDGVDLERCELATAVESWPRAAALWGERARTARGEARVHAQVRLAEAYRRMGAFTDAAQALADIEIEGEEPVWLQAERADLATAMQRWDEALDRWEALAAHAAAPERTLLRLAEVLARIGRGEHALAALDAYLASGGRERAAHERQARALRLALASGLRGDRGEDTGITRRPPDEEDTDRGGEVVYLGRMIRGGTS